MVTDVQTWINNPSSNRGWAIVDATPTEGKMLWVMSKEGPANQRPELTVTFTPPSGCTLPTFGPNVVASDPSACDVGTLLLPGEQCTVQCNTTFKFGGGTTSYDCAVGGLTEATLTCVPEDGMSAHVHRHTYDLLIVRGQHARSVTVCSTVTCKVAAHLLALMAHSCLLEAHALLRVPLDFQELVPRLRPALTGP